jgi:hypothetical protein
MTSVGDLSSDYLAKLINDEYEVVLVSERANLPRAKAIGEKLEVLRARTKHGEWQTKLREWCPRISYETATRYIRVYRRWPDIEQAAAVKSVKTTDLTIDDALRLLAKPKDDNNSEMPQDNGEVDERSAQQSDEDSAIGWLKALAPDELVILLRQIHGAEYLTALSAELAKAFGLQSPYIG